MSHFASKYMHLVAVLTTAWSPLAGASPAIVEEVKHVISKYDLETAQTALEVGPNAAYFTSS
jgi:diketogulonate reductase-like aldo/keto reductase